MTSPKGTSKAPQSFVYKRSESKLIEQSEVEDHIADGWFDNPADAKNPPMNEAAAETVDEEVPTDKPETGPDLSQTPSPSDKPIPEAEADLEVDASGTAFDGGLHYVDKRKDVVGNWTVKKRLSK